MIPLIEGIKNVDLPQGWNKNYLNELFEFSGGLSISREQLGKSGFCYLHYGDIHTTTKNCFDVETDYECLPKLDVIIDTVKKESILENGDVVFVDASEDYLGASKHIVVKNEKNIPFISGLHTIVAKSKDNSICNDYKKYCFQTNNIRKQFYFYTTGIKVYGLSKPNILKLIIALPPTIEQEKISEILSTCEKIIDLKQKLIEEKENQKQWLMAKLLSPKDGWKTYKLGSLGATYSGLSGKSKNSFGFGKPYISYMNIFSNPIIDRTQFEYVEISQNEKQNKVQYGDIFFTTSSETYDEVGMTSVILEKINELYLNSFCFGFRLHDFTTIKPEFAVYFFRAKEMRKKLNILAQGATRSNLSKNSLMKCKIIVPTINEQTAIANILSTVDREIDLLKQELSEWKSKKIALMQLLLTGKVRTVANIS